MPARRPNAFDRWISRLLLAAGVLFLAMALVKPLLLGFGGRAAGRVTYQARGGSRQGAFKARYTFTDHDGKKNSGCAYTGGKRVVGATVPIAYFVWIPSINMPASPGYALVTGLGWLMASLGALGIGRVLMKKK